MTALRQRLIEDMQVRNYSPRTVEAYVAAVAKLAKHFRRAPDQLAKEDVRAFQVHLLAQKVSWSQFNQIVAGLRFFFGTTLGRSGVIEMLPYGKRPKRLPVVLSVEEVTQLLEAAKPGRERVLLQTAYACGLRISELLHLQVTDIDSARMVVHVRQGKGAKDRQVPLSPRLLTELRQWWCRHRTRPWLFPGMTEASRARPMNVTSVQRMCKEVVAREAAEGGVDAHAAAQLCDAPVGSGRGRGDAAKVVGSHQPVNDGAVSSREHAATTEDAGSVGVADQGEAGGEGCLSPWPARVRFWK